MIGLGNDFQRDLRFDEFLMLGADETEAVAELLAPALDAKRQRARKATETAAFNRTVGLVVANALVGGERGVHYSRRDEDYGGASPYKPEWLGSKRLRSVVDGLAEHGLLEVLGGSWAGPFTKGVQSSFKATPDLMAELKALEIDLPAVQRDCANAPVIELRDENKRRIRYDANAEWVAQRIEELRAFNAFIREQDISLPGKATQSFGGLTRIYNDGSWERGGRHFRGWWQGVSSDERCGILINGEKTVELDFEGFHPRLLYHRSGRDFGGDPYDIPKLRQHMDEAGMDWESEGRGIVKKAFNVLLNIPSRNTIYKMKDEFPDQRVPLKEVVRSIIEYHDPIKNSFFKVVSPTLMNLESDICNQIILSGMADGVVILPIFDSFITTENDGDYLFELMSSSYDWNVGFYPIINLYNKIVPPPSTPLVETISSPIPIDLIQKI